MKRLLIAPSKSGLFVLLLILTVIALGVPCAAQSSEGAAEESVEETREQLEEAILWLLRVTPRARLYRDEEERLERIDEILEFSWKYDHDPFLIASMIYCESSYRPDVIGKSKNEIGLMQVHGGALRRCIDRGFDLSEPRGQIECGTWYLRDRIDFCGSVRGGLSAYAAGKCSLRPESRAARVVERRFRLAEKLKGVDYEPQRETDRS